MVDGGYRVQASIVRAEAHGVKVYAPRPEKRDNAKAPRDPKPGDGPGVSKRRRRLRSDVSQEIHTDGAATAERTNADPRCHRGLDLLRVRGLDKFSSVALWAALASNVMRCIDLGPWQ